MSVAVGFCLQPEERFLELLDPVLRALPEYFEVVPETLWFGSADGSVRPNAFQERFLALGEECGVPFVAHGVGLSLGTLAEDDAPRFARDLERVVALHARYDFRWYTDHLAASRLGGEDLILPLPLPFDPEVARHVRARLERLRDVVGLAGVENTVTYFELAPARDEPRFLREVLDADGLVWVLDLHNLYTMAANLGLDVAEWLAAAPLERVVELHVSGGADSDPRWLPDGRTLRLDSHDSAVPEPVWELLDDVLPRCPNLRGVTLERMEGTVGEADVRGVRAELERLREVCA